MRTRSLPFQLEQDTPGTFLLQGLTGGVLLGFIFALSIALNYQGPFVFRFIHFTPVAITIAGALGVLIALPLWGMYRLTDIQMWAPVRIAVSTITLTLLLAFFNYPFVQVEPFIFAVTAVLCVLPSLPIALLVGSRVQPGRFFTFWKIMVQQDGLTRRLNVTGIPEIGGVLPLRVLSVIGLVCSLLVAAAAWSISEGDRKQDIILGPGAIVYFALSAYLTFSSPTRHVLFFAGLVINLPIISVALFYPEAWIDDTRPLVAIVCVILLAAWGAFMVTRFIVDKRFT